MIELFENIALGFSTAIMPQTLLYSAIGVSLGMIFGVLPGIGPLAGIAMLFPLTYYLDPITAVVMLGGIYYGTAYGGSIASILLNLPGTANTAVTCLDGYPMAQQGRAGVALFMTTIASFVGGSIGILLLMLFSPIIVIGAIGMGSADYFSLMVLGLVSASVMTVGSTIKGIAMVIVGVLLGVIGLDAYTGVARYTFGVLELADGINLVALAMGIFGVAEVVTQIGKAGNDDITRGATLRSMLPTRDDVRRSWLPTLRGAGVGSFFGALPGAGGTIAAFMAYAIEKNISRDPGRFGKGAIEGITAPESANNAADQTAFIPTLALGIPGSATMALILSVLIIHGITPGPGLMSQHPDLFWGLIMSFWIGNLLLLVLNLPLIRVWVMVLSIPYKYLFPSILVFVCIGVFSVNNNPFDVLMVVAFAAIGYAMRIGGYPAAPMLLGFVLGPMLEDNFRRALLLSRGDYAVFFTSTASLIFLVLTMALLGWNLRMAFSRKPIRVANAGVGED